jgi:hypothetical protein
MIVMKRVLGWQPATESLRMLRVLLLTSNALPIALFLVALLLLLERLDASARASSILMITAGFGTLVTTFAVSLTNHVGATAGAGIALYAFHRIWSDTDPRAKHFALAGLAAGWTASQEVPALCLVAILAVPLFARSRRATLALYLPCALIPLIAFWTTSGLALGDPFWFYHPAPIWSKFPGSYWVETAGIDRGEGSSFWYLFHFTFGHHGVFSLAPIFLLSFAGMLRLMRRSQIQSLIAVLVLCAVAAAMRHLYRELSVPLPIAMAPFALAAGYLLLKRDDMMLRLSASATLLTFGFYLVRTQNYGGVSAGARWLMWLIPLWLIAAQPVLEDALASRKKTLAILAALAVSIFSATYNSTNPWTHPWLYELFTAEEPVHESGVRPARGDAGWAPFSVQIGRKQRHFRSDPTENLASPASCC